jgi:hypothetical protein
MRRSKIPVSAAIGCDVNNTAPMNTAAKVAGSRRPFRVTTQISNEVIMMTQGPPCAAAEASKVMLDMASVDEASQK